MRTLHNSRRGNHSRNIVDHSRRGDSAIVDHNRNNNIAHPGNDHVTFFPLTLICNAKARGKQRKMDEITDIIDKVNDFIANTVGNGKKGLSKRKGHGERNVCNNYIH